MRKCLSAHARHVQQRKEAVKHAIVSNLRLSLDPNIRRSERALDIFHFFGTRRLRDQKLDNAVSKAAVTVQSNVVEGFFLEPKTSFTGSSSETLLRSEAFSSLRRSLSERKRT